ncbi:hypothetical protein PAPYR_958 [Paratrimastix pyriformis]|uniref:Uncharacterized protein n=1 Tax=Paratrimastix pyriformis TaxID=342808 RepID=A0ABQ8UT86_9EUKA|nr:hypothetical protein PAPYR_958 [Paratrimastix pyriformis]
MTLRLFLGFIFVCSVLGGESLTFIWPHSGATVYLPVTGVRPRNVTFDAELRSKEGRLVTFSLSDHRTGSVVLGGDYLFSSLSTLSPTRYVFYYNISDSFVPGQYDLRLNTTSPDKAEEVMETVAVNYALYLQPSSLPVGVLVLLLLLGISLLVGFVLAAWLWSRWRTRRDAAHGDVDHPYHHLSSDEDLSAQGKFLPVTPTPLGVVESQRDTPPVGSIQ